MVPTGTTPHHTRYVVNTEYISPDIAGGTSSLIDHDRVFVCCMLLCYTYWIDVRAVSLGSLLVEIVVDEVFAAAGAAKGIMVDDDDDFVVAI